MIIKAKDLIDHSTKKTYLTKGNAAMRAGNFSEALQLFQKAKLQIPALDETINFNINLAQARLRTVSPDESKNKKNSALLSSLNPKPKLPITVLVITWDIGHNPLGRSYMLAEALDRVVRNVVLTGFQFERYGNSVWEPLRSGKIPVIPLKGELFPDLLYEFDKIIKKFKPDIVFACKPRLPSLQLGAMFKERYNIPLIVDIDDHELSFTKSRKKIEIDSFLSLEKNQIANELEPYSDLWTQLSNDLVNYADAKIVSNVALQREFGGEIIPHARDETLFDQSLYNKTEQRIKYKVPTSAKVVMFFGTPRHHKGVGALAEAIGKIRDPNFILVIVGTAPDRSVTNKLETLSKGRLINLPNQPFSAIPEIVSMADIICLPQDENHETSKYQLPAKAIDAVAMGIPLFVSNTEPLMQLVNDGVAELIDTKNLHNEIIANAGRLTNKEKKSRRDRFLEKYSYAAIGDTLRSIINNLIQTEPTTNNLFDLKRLLSFQKNIFPNQNNNARKTGRDIVIFWKQNDTSMYGRRHDMIIKYLSSRNDVRKIVVVDSPISEFDLLQMRAGSKLTQDRNIYVKTYQKIFSQIDTEKTSYNVFAHKPGIYTYDRNDKKRKFIFPDYASYLTEIFYQNNLDPSNSVFWFYPKNYLSKEIISHFKPRKVVVDIVDDHRAWPNITDDEKAKLTDHYKEIITASNYSLANCSPVINSMKTFSPNIHLVPNGCEDVPEIVEPSNNPLYDELKNNNGMVIGFVGNLEAKIDIALIEKIADRFRDSLVVLVGSTHANPSARKLAEIPNVRMFGVVEYKFINAIISKFSIGIVPHKAMDLTQNMNPLKIFVYLSNKIPVVCTNIQNVPNTKGILISEDHKDFIKNCEIALSNPIPQENFDEFINNNSWKFRLESHIDRILL